MGLEAACASFEFWEQSFSSKRHEIYGRGIPGGSCSRSSRRERRVRGSYELLARVDRQTRVDRGGRAHDRPDGTGWGETTLGGRVRRSLSSRRLGAIPLSRMLTPACDQSREHRVPVSLRTKAELLAHAHLRLLIRCRVHIFSVEDKIISSNDVEMLIGVSVSPTERSNFRIKEFKLNFPNFLQWNLHVWNANRSDSEVSHLSEITKV